MKALITSALIGISAAVQASAVVPQTHVYRSDNNFNVIEGDVSVTHSDAGSARLVTITGADATVRLTTDKVDHIDIKTVAVPRLRIDIPSNPDMPQVQDKESYVGALVSIEGNGYIDDYPQAKVNIKGRGNSTWWMMPKKPMRLKFDKKTPFGGLAKAKSFVLLANYIDPTLMRNAVAMKIAELIEIPWANHIIPVNVTFNGADLGAFMLTEKIGINGASVDIDETKGMLFELSNEFDEPYEFYSSTYGLPVMVKDPDLAEISAENPSLGTPAQILARWQTDFNNAELKVKQGKGFEAFDLDSFVDYLFLYNLCNNSEIGHPKSVYVHKTDLGEQSLYMMGPVWDFDMAFNKCVPVDGRFEPAPPTDNLWLNQLFGKLVATRGFMERYKEVVADFEQNKFPLLLEFFDQYARLIKPSAKNNGLIWPAEESIGFIWALNSFDHERHVADLRQWLIDRMAHIAEAARHNRLQ